jgi:hypothetical protein
VLIVAVVVSWCTANSVAIRQMGLIRRDYSQFVGQKREKEDPILKCSSTNIWTYQRIIEIIAHDNSMFRFAFN